MAGTQKKGALSRVPGRALGWAPAREGVLDQIRGPGKGAARQAEDKARAGPAIRGCLAHPAATHGRDCRYSGDLKSGRGSRGSRE